MLLLSLFALLAPLNDECDEVRPHRTGLSEARKEDVFEEAPENRERDEVDELADGVFVFLPDDPKLLALLIKS